MVILNRKQPLRRGLVPPEGITVYHNSSAWMTSDLRKEWILRNNQVLRDKHLLMDSFSGHKTTSVIGVLDTCSLSGYSIIPARTTSELQPLDVGVNKPFKDRLRNEWNKWNETLELTPGGNYKSVSVSMLLQWVKEAWDEITTSSILNAFRKALTEP